jgi:hypothetical protein
VHSAKMHWFIALVRTGCGPIAAQLRRAHSSGFFEREDITMAQASLSKELWQFMKQRKKFWLLPIILIMVLVGGLLVFAQGSALAPFIYTIF